MLKGGGQLSEQYLYILLDPSSKYVITRGMDLRFFKEAVQHVPQNILLLSGEDPLAEKDELTRFQVIRGNLAVAQFLDKEAQAPTAKWVDFASWDLLNQLNPGEIAELLYLAHMNRHLHAPFFYKLQNRYVILPGESASLKVYYRDLNEFYRQLAFLIQAYAVELLPKSQTKWRLFTNRRDRQAGIVLPQVSLLSSLEDILEEGVILDFSNLKAKDPLEQVIRFYLAEDDIHAPLSTPNMTECLGNLSLTTDRKCWQGDWGLDSVNYGG